MTHLLLSSYTFSLRLSELISSSVTRTPVHSLSSSTSPPPLHILSFFPPSSLTMVAINQIKAVAASLALIAIVAPQQGVEAAPALRANSREAVLPSVGRRMERVVVRSTSPPLPAGVNVEPERRSPAASKPKTAPAPAKKPAKTPAKAGAGNDHRHIHEHVSCKTSAQTLKLSH